MDKGEEEEEFKAEESSQDAESSESEQEEKKEVKKSVAAKADSKRGAEMGTQRKRLPLKQRPLVRMQKKEEREQRLLKKVDLVESPENLQRIKR